jgi:thiol:disulfide interchange protein DsbD
MRDHLQIANSDRNVDTKTNGFGLPTSNLNQAVALLITVAIALFSATFSQASLAESSRLKPALQVSAFSDGKTQQEPEFLPLKEAFQPTVKLKGDKIHIHWVIADDYYLYRKRLKFESSDEAVALGDAVFSRQGKIKEDEFFGQVEVFHHDIKIEVPILAAADTFEFVMRYQGCAEAGLCYPPSKHRVKLTPNAPIAHSAAASAQNTGAQSTAQDTEKTGMVMDRNDANSLAAFINSSSTMAVFAIFFLLGLGLTFTPCVLPMIPILSGIIAGQQQPVSTRKGFAMSTAYVLGMAMTFAAAGMIVSITGARIQIYMQDPIVLSVFAVVFIALALAMFGFYELQLPSVIRDRLTNVSAKQEGGNLIGVFFMGVLSALVVSPCVSAPLAGALLAMAQAGDMIKGGLTLLALGLGMGAPLIVIGTTGANIMPRAGMWMDRVKAVFGVLLLAVGAYLIRTVLPGELMMIIWAALLIIPGIYMGALGHPQTSWQYFFKGLGLMLVLYGICLIVGAASGQTNPLKPLAMTNVMSAGSIAGPTSPAKGAPFEVVTSIDQMDARLQAAREAGKPVMIDYYADWCIACVQMEATTFKDPEVISSLNDFDLIKIDLTDNEQTDALLDKYNLIGPPTMLFFSRNGEYQADATIMSGMNPKVFKKHLKQQVMPRI